MSDDASSRRKALSARPRAYEVGYGKPPVETRFAKGQSGNPAGRPKGTRNKPKLPALNEERLKAIILTEAYRTIRINDGTRQVSVPMAQAVMRSLAVNAAKGNQRAQRLFTQLIGTVERENRKLHDEFLDVAMTYKIEWERELDRRARLGLSGPEPLPHPDHVHIDMRSGQVRIVGPSTREEKAKYETFAEARTAFREEIEELRTLLRDDPDCDYRDQVLDDIRHNERLIEIISRVVPE